MNELHFISMQCAYKRAYVKGKYNFKARWGGGANLYTPLLGLCIMYVYLLCLYDLHLNSNSFFILGDRFFFTHAGRFKRFHFKLRKLLFKRRLRDIVCENTKIPQAQKNLFKTRGSKISCSDTNPLDISLFI